MHGILLGILLGILIMLLVPYLLSFDKLDEHADDEKEIIFDPQSLLVSPDPSNLDYYTQKVIELAEEDNILSIGENCDMSPMILKSNVNSQILIENNDSAGRGLVFENQKKDALTFSLPPKSMMDFSPRVFGLSKGIYRYQCDQAKGGENDGILYIVE